MTTYYKVLKDGKSCHGGSMEWPLPVLNGHWTPGTWVEHAGPCRMCESGLHVTSAPLKWYVWGCEVYEAEIGEIHGREVDKIVTNRVRLLRQVEHPEWWLDVMAFVNSIKNVKWFSNGHLGVHPGIKMFPALKTAGAAARDTAWAAALNALILITKDLPVDRKHQDHAALRWSIWEAGYGVLCDVNGILYCYKKP